jgi:hypothetical protein
VATNKLSQYADAQALAAVFRQAQSPATGNVYVALLTATPTDTALTMAALTEYAATGYARQVYGPGAPTAAVPSVIANLAQIVFGVLTGANGTTPVTGWAICDAVSGTSANVIATGLWSLARTPSAGDSLAVAAGALTHSNS